MVRKPGTGEIIAISANQIVLLKFLRGTNMLYYIHQTAFPLGGLKGGLGTRLVGVICIIGLLSTTWLRFQSLTLPYAGREG